MSILGRIKSSCLTAGSPFWKVIAQLRGIVVGSGFTCIGRPGFNRKRSSVISFGNKVTLCSSGMANPVAEGGRCRFATLGPRAEILIGNGVGMSSTLICAATSVVVGEGTQIGGGAMIIDTDFHYRTLEGEWGTDPKAVSRPVVIGKNCFIGTRAIILKGVTVGDNAVIGAGAVVSRDVEVNTVVAGNPAIVIKGNL